MTMNDLVMLFLTVAFFSALLFAIIVSGILVGLLLYDKIKSPSPEVNKFTYSGSLEGFRSEIIDKQGGILDFNAEDLELEKQK